MTIKGSRSERKRRNVIGSIYIAFEGFKTEPNYFKAIDSLRLYDSSKFTLLPRNKSEKGKSNAKNVLKFLENNQRWIESNNNRCPWSIFITRLVEAIVDKYEPLEPILYRETIKKHDNHSDSIFEEIRAINDELFKLMKQEHKIIGGSDVDVVEALPIAKEYLNKRYRNYTFEEIIPNDFEPPVSFGNNHYVMIIDRDQMTNKEEMLHDVIKSCEKNGYTLVMTNPNFELWVAMHLNGYKHNDMMDCIKEMVNQQSRKKEDRTVSGELGPIKYVKTLYPAYRKNSDFKFITKEMVDTAIKRSKQYPNEIEILKNPLNDDDLSSVGTNMARLFSIFENGDTIETGLFENIQIYRAG